MVRFELVILFLAALTASPDAGASEGDPSAKPPRPRILDQTIRIRVDHASQSLQGDCTLRLAGGKPKEDVTLDFDFLDGTIDHVYLNGKAHDDFVYKNHTGLSPEQTKKYDVAMPDVKDMPISQPGVKPALYFIKGASALHMLRGMYGYDAFKKGMRNYFEDYAGKETTVEDLCRAFEDATSDDLAWFFDQWYKKPGAPRLEAAWKVDGEKVTLAIRQPKAPLFRLDRFPVQLKSVDGKTQTRRIDVLAKAEQQFVLRAKGEVKDVVLDEEDWFLKEIIKPAALLDEHNYGARKQELMDYIAARQKQAEEARLALKKYDAEFKKAADAHPDRKAYSEAMAQTKSVRATLADVDRQIARKKQDLVLARQETQRALAQLESRRRTALADLESLYERRLRDAARDDATDEEKP